MTDNSDSSPHADDVSIVIPAKNEATSLRKLLPKIRELMPNAEVIVVDDGSTDETNSVSREAGITVRQHIHSLGNGAAIKSGARLASRDIVIFMDGDGQHNPELIDPLLKDLRRGFDMVIGSRKHGSHASKGRLLANYIYNKLASYMTGNQVKDLTSGFRAVRREKFLDFLHLLPNGFSYPTTITMAFFRAGFSINYIPIDSPPRTGKSHIRPTRDGIRFLLIIFKVATLYSPLKIFFPTSAAIFGTGVLYYAYTFATQQRFTNMSALLFTTAVIVFLIGLVSEQITQLMYKDQTPRD